MLAVWSFGANAANCHW